MNAIETPTPRTVKMFPIMDGPSVPWEIMMPHEAQAQRNHGQSLQRLAERGGLGAGEAWCVVQDMHWGCANKGAWDDYRAKWISFANGINHEFRQLRAELAAMTKERDRLRGTVEWISNQQNLFFAECSQAEEIIARCRASLTPSEASEPSSTSPQTQTPC